MQKHLEVSSFKNESSFLFLPCSLDYLGLVKIHSLVRGWKYFPPGSKVLIFFSTQLCQSAEGVKGESSPSTAWLYLPINVMPFPHLISLCDHPSYRTGTAPILPIRTHWSHQETLKQFAGWTPDIWIGPEMGKKRTLTWRRAQLKLFYSLMGKLKTDVHILTNNPPRATMTYSVSLHFSWKLIAPITSGIQIQLQTGS